MVQDMKNILSASAGADLSAPRQKAAGRAGGNA
jgi:hypothetical protein